MTKSSPASLSVDPSALEQVAGTALKVAEEACHLASIVKLAAFAVEARRTLDEIDRCSEIHVGAAKQLLSHVQYPDQWAEHEDVAADVLRVIADRMNGISDEMDRVYSHAKAVMGAEESVSPAGEASNAVIDAR